MKKGGRSSEEEVGRGACLGAAVVGDWQRRS